MSELCFDVEKKEPQFACLRGEARAREVSVRRV